MADKFEFVKWCEEWELEEDTIQILVEKGFKSYKSLRHLSDDMIGRHFKGIKPGQQALLREGAAILHIPAPSSTPTNITPSLTVGPSTSTTTDTPADLTTSPTAATAVPAAPSMPTAETALSPTDIAALFAGTSGTTTNVAGETPDDPYGLGTGVHRGSKWRKIPDYIRHCKFFEQKDQTFEICGLSVTKKESAADFKKVTIAQYMEGAMRILREQVLDDEMSRAQIVNYVNYIIQVSAFAQTRNWESVLNYDSVYRREQHAQGFRWGAQSAFLMSTLRPKDTPAVRDESKTKKQDSINPKSKKIICGRWNSWSGCSSQECRYDHVCKICYSGEHNAATHREQQLAPKNK